MEQPDGTEALARTGPIRPPTPVLQELQANRSYKLTAAKLNGFILLFSEQKHVIKKSVSHRPEKTVGLFASALS